MSCCHTHFGLISATADAYIYGQRTVHTGRAYESVESMRHAFLHDGTEYAENSAKMTGSICVLSRRNALPSSHAARHASSARHFRRKAVDDGRIQERAATQCMHASVLLLARRYSIRQFETKYAPRSGALRKILVIMVHPKIEILRAVCTLKTSPPSP